MPQVITREIDETTAVADAYSNFSVVIPGLVANENAESWAKVADSEGIYECSSLSDFKKYIGKVADAEGSDANPCELMQTISNADEAYADGISQTQYEQAIDEFQNRLTNQCFCTGKEAAGNTPAGEFCDGIYKYTGVIETADAFKELFEVTSEEGAEETTYKLKSTLYLIEKGKNAIESRPGNRLAYMLVELGYTILFKAVNKPKKGSEEYPSASKIVTKLSDSNFWECLKDRATYDFRYVVSGGYYDEGVYAAMMGLAARVNEKNYPNDSHDWYSEGRGDVTALCDVDETALSDVSSQSKTIESIQDWVGDLTCFTIKSQDAGRYGALFAPRVKVQVAADKGAYGTDTSYLIPASIYYLACAAKASENYAEWYAVAGYNRGVSGYTVLGTTLTLGDQAVQRLEPRYAWSNDGKPARSVNVITKIRTLGTGGYFLWGSRTAHCLSADGLIASHFLNIRQLCTTLKKDIYVSCKQLTFSPNDTLLWIDFLAKIRPTLDKMKSDRGIKDYEIKQVVAKKKALMKAKIKLVPIEPVEDFDISVYLEDSIDGSTEATAVED